MEENKRGWTLGREMGTYEDDERRTLEEDERLVPQEGGEDQREVEDDRLVSQKGDRSHEEWRRAGLDPPRKDTGPVWDVGARLTGVAVVFTSGTVGGGHGEWWDE